MEINPAESPELIATEINQRRASSTNLAEISTNISNKFSDPMEAGSKRHNNDNKKFKNFEGNVH